MRQFLGLMKFEHVYYTMAYVTIAILGMVGVFIGPYGMQYIGSEASIDVMRFGTILFSAICVFGISMVMFGLSLHKSVQMKDMWLHSSASIYKLIGGKVVYHLVALLAVEGSLFIGFLFVKEIMTGSFTQFIVFAFYSTSLTIVGYVVVVLFVFVGLTLNLQLAHYVKKFSIVFMLAAYVGFFMLLDYMPNFSFLQVGYVDLAFLNTYMPVVMEANYAITLFFSDFYVGLEIFSWFVIAIVFIGTCKWLERVLMR